MQRPGFPERLLIDGAWRDATSGATYPVLSPATNEEIAAVPDGGRADVDSAVAAARFAFDEGPWPRMDARERGRILLRVAALLEQATDEFAVLESRNAGKPIRESRLIDVPLAVDSFEYYAGFATKLAGQTLPLPGDVLSYTVREPVGVVGAITPFNFPLMLASWKIAPALAFGNTMVIKPSSETPLTTLLLGEIGLEAGLPDGVLNVVTGGAQAGAAIVDHPGIDAVSFTGSTAVGRVIARDAGARLARISLELGGKGPNIVFDDASLDDAVAGALFGVYWTQGQICTAGSRLFVQRGIHDEFVERFIDRASRLRIGDPLDEDTQVGPLISTRQLDRVLDYIEQGRGEGASLALGGDRPADEPLVDGNFVNPTVFIGASNDMTIAREEIFGPVATVIAFDDVEEVVGLANATDFGLSAGVWTNDLKLAHRTARALRSGTVWINAFNIVTSEAPFGGFRQSGWGRENGFGAVDLYTETKHVYVNLAERSLDWFGDAG